MKYKNTEMTVDTLISSLNEQKIKLNPPFQRSSVWTLPARRRLIRNMLLERPIPAIFLFKRAEDIKTVSYVLDGKQRLESLILFIADRRDNAKIKQPKHYFFRKPEVQRQIGFEVNLDGEPVGFSDLDQDIARKFLTAQIAVIEVDFPDGDTEQASLHDVIQLFVDINETGKKVSRIEIVRALSESIQKDALFTSLLRLVGIVQPRHQGKSVFNKPIDSNYTFVLKRLRDVVRATDSKRQVDIMWERLHEFALFTKTKAHREPSDILKGLIAGAKNAKLTNAEKKTLKDVFAFLARAYGENRNLQESKFATDQPQFYTMVTTLLSSDLMTSIQREQLTDAIGQFAAYANGSATAPTEDIRIHAENFIAATRRQTTHPKQRKQRQDALVAGVKLIVALDAAAV